MDQDWNVKMEIRPLNGQVCVYLKVKLAHPEGALPQARADLKWTTLFIFGGTLEEAFAWIRDEQKRLFGDITIRIGKSVEQFDGNGELIAVHSFIW